MPPSPKTHDGSTNIQPTFVIPTTPPYVLQTVNPTVCINSFSCPTNKIPTNILTLLLPHVVIAPTTDPIISLIHLFGTYGFLQHFFNLN